MSDSDAGTMPHEGIRLEPRCRVCRNDDVRDKVNNMLAAGSSYAMIVRALDADNDRMDVRDRITLDSIRNHCARHFPVQNAAAATYRAVLERRAAENKVDFINGVATAVTPLAVLETIMLKGYEALVSTDTKIDAHTTMAAAAKLHALLDAGSEQAQIADVFVKQERIIQAMREFVPEDKVPAMLARIEGTFTGSADGGMPSEPSAGLREYDPDLVTDEDDYDDY